MLNPGTTGITDILTTMEDIEAIMAGEDIMDIPTGKSFLLTEFYSSALMSLKSILKKYCQNSEYA